MSKNSIPYLFFFLFLLSSCSEESENPVKKSALNYSFLENFPRELPEITLIDDYVLTQDRIALGRLLFEDKRLSRTNEIACASCHKPEFAFADNTPTSKGVDGLDGTRNSISLMNVVHQQRLLREGGVPTLEIQVLVPFQEHNEFDLNIVEAAEKLGSDTEYQNLAMKAYNRSFDPYVISRAISAYERTLVGGNSKFDDYINERASLTTEEEEGMVLFFSDSLACSSCHSGILFTSQKFDNIGIYDEYKDIGKKRLTGLDSDNGVFKIPSLRNVSKTAPYMHDGSISSLDEVIEHYNKGGTNHRNKSKMIKGFQITDSQKKAIIAFLNTLEEEIK